jgi:hypothetical protein
LREPITVVENFVMRRMLWLVAFAALAGAGCSKFLSSQAGPSPTATPQGMTGSWASVASATATDTCTDFHWTITELNGTTGAGTFTAKCLGTMAVSGTAHGTLTGTSVSWTADAVGTSDGESCPIALSGTATFDGTQFRIPYSGTTCKGPISGTEILRKN